MTSDENSVPSSLTEEDIAYIDKVLGMHYAVASPSWGWNVALYIRTIPRWPFVHIRNAGWYILTKNIKWNEPLSSQDGTIGPFNTIQDAGTAWALLGNPEGSR